MKKLLDKIKKFMVWLFIDPHPENREDLAKNRYKMMEDKKDV